MSQMIRPKRVIVDTDAGVDDALALILALKSPELKVEAITTVSGNVLVDQVCTNVFRIFDLLRWEDVPPVARGADRSLQGTFTGAEEVHGRDGLGDLDEFYDQGKRRYPDPKPRLSPLSAEDLILEMVKRHPGEVTLITLAPLTNLARALLKNEAALRGLSEVVMMGGAVTVSGNITPYAEFNVGTDPEAAQLVLQAGLPIIMVGLDVTHKVTLSKREVEERMRARPNPLSRFIRDCTGKYMEFHRRVEGFEGCYLHDPLAVGVAIDPSLVERKRMPLEVVIAAGPTRGQVKPRASEQSAEGESAVEVCLHVEADRFLSLFLERVYNDD